MISSIRKIVLLVKIWIFFPMGLSAHQPSYVNYTINDGLPSNTVYSSLQDSKGYLWFGTDKGVVRFDGSKFTIFNTSDGMADNIVYDIFEDSKNRIWFSCNNGNACYYYNHKFWNKTTDSTLSKLSANSLGLKVIEDRVGNIFILSQFQLFKISNKNEKTEIAVRGAYMFSSLVLNELGEAIALSNEGFYNTSTGKMKLFPNRALNRPLLYSKAIYFKNRAYYNHNAAISHFVPSNAITEIESIPVTKEPLMAQCLQMTEDSCLLAGTQNGLVTYSLKTKTIIDKTFNGFSISSFTRDKEHNFWMTSLNNGVILSVNSKVKLFNEKAGLNFNYSGFIDKLSDGTIAIGSNKYLASFIEKGAIHNLSLPHNAGEGKIEKIRIGPDGHYYLTCGAVIIKVDKSNWTSKVLRISARDLLFNGPSQVILVGGNGVLILYSSDFESVYRSQSWRSNPNDGTFLPNIKASGIYKGNYSNRVYIYGLLGVKYLRENQLVSILNNHEYLSKNIYRIGETRDGLTCFASNIYGLIVLYKNKIFSLNKTNGLRTNIVNSLYIDSSDQVWATTSEGLSKVNYTIEKENLMFSIKNYSRSDGMPTTNINDITMDGNIIYVSTDNGVCVFSENDLKRNATKPTVNIEAIYINEKTQPISSNYTAEYPNNSLRIKFIGLSYNSFGKLSYKYRMKNLENNWKYTQNNVLEYPSIPYGQYDFELIVLNAKNIESNVQTFHIRVNPPFWRTWWFYLFVLLMSISLVFLFVKMRLNSMRKSHATTQQLLQMEQKNMEADKKQALYEKEILDIQNQALRLHMNPHFIFNSINSIQGFYASGDTALARSYIGKFSTLLRMILDQSKKKFIDINDEVKTIEYYLELNKLRFENKFDYEISVDKTLLIHREEIPPMLLQPFIENAIIHGIAPLKRPGKIIVRLLDDKDFIRCEIEDNGVGRAYSRNMNVNKTYESTGIKVTEKRIELNNKMIIGLHQDEVVISDILNSAGEVMGTLVQFSVLKNSI